MNLPRPGSTANKAITAICLIVGGLFGYFVVGDVITMAIDARVAVHHCECAK